ncbi:MAG: PQQ-binding-like beta-propeller repeat protein [Pseudomonadota bacterium]
MAVRGRFAGTVALVVGLAISGCGDDATRSVPLAAQGLYTAALSTTGDLALVGSLNHGASLWKSDAHERVYSWNHSDDDFSALNAADIADDGRFAVTADPRTLVVWNIETGAAESFWATPGAVLDLALDTDGARVLMGLEDHSAVYFDAESGAHLYTFLHEGEVTSVDLTRDGETALTASEDGTAKVWDLTSGELRLKIATGGPLRVATLSADGHWLLLAARNAEVDLIDLKAGRRSSRIYRRNPGIVSARFDASGTLLALGLANRAAQIVDVGTGMLLEKLHLPQSPTLGRGGRAVLDLAFTRRGGLLAISGDGRLNTLANKNQPPRSAARARS